MKPALVVLVVVGSVGLVDWVVDTAGGVVGQVVGVDGDFVVVAGRVDPTDDLADAADPADPVQKQRKIKFL